MVGVLAALWIDAGWSWLQDREEEQLILADLAADFQANLETIDQTLEAHDRQLQAVQKGLTADLSTLPMEELLPMTRNVFVLETFLPRRGAADAVISSGRINLLRNRELRTALTGWGRLVLEASEEVEWALPGNFELLTRTARQEGAFFNISVDRAQQPVADTAMARAWMTTVFADREAVALLKVKSVFVVEARPDFLNLKDETARILAMILES